MMCCQDRHSSLRDSKYTAPVVPLDAKLCLYAKAQQVPRLVQSYLQLTHVVLHWCAAQQQPPVHRQLQQCCTCGAGAGLQAVSLVKNQHLVAEQEAEQGAEQVTELGTWGHQGGNVSTADIHPSTSAVLAAQQACSTGMPPLPGLKSQSEPQSCVHAGCLSWHCGW